MVRTRKQQLANKRWEEFCSSCVLQAGGGGVLQGFFVLCGIFSCSLDFGNAKKTKFSYNSPKISTWGRMEV